MWHVYRIKRSPDSHVLEFGSSLRYFGDLFHCYHIPCGESIISKQYQFSWKIGDGGDGGDDSDIEEEDKYLIKGKQNSGGKCEEHSQKTSCLYSNNHEIKIRIYNWDDPSHVVAVAW